MNAHTPALAALFAMGILFSPQLARAQEKPSPASTPVTSPTPEASPAPAAPEATPQAFEGPLTETPRMDTAPASAPDIKKQFVLWNPKFDPCGGYQELLMKYLVGTACTYRRGEGIVAASYYAVWAPSNTQLILNGAQATAHTNVNIHAYPKEETIIGLTPRDQFTYYGPSYADVVQNGHVTAAGTTDQIFLYKREVYFNAKGSFLGAIQLVYNAPTGSPVFTGGGPLYKINPIVLFPIGYRLAINFNLPAVSAPFTDNSGASGRAWSFAPTMGFTWRSPRAFMENLVFGFNSASGQVSVINVMTQQIGRHFGIEAGFLLNASNVTEELNNIISIKNKTSVYAVNVGLVYQWNQSEIINGGPPVPFPRPGCPMC